MEQYIQKDALVVEIKRRKELVSDPILSGNDLMIGERNAYFNLLSFLDTLEVKEVNLVKELSWQDVKRLAEIGEAFMNSKESDNLSEEEYYTEILNKFKA